MSDLIERFSYDVWYNAKNLYDELRHDKVEAIFAVSKEIQDTIDLLELCKKEIEKQKQ